MGKVTVKNLEWRPITVEVARGKRVSISPRGTGTISEEEFHSAGFQQAFKAGRVFPLPVAPAVTPAVSAESPASSTELPDQAIAVDETPQENG